MSKWKAAKVGLNLRVKRWAGMPHRSRARTSWNMSAGEFWDYQATAFKSMYAFARRRVPFYQNHTELYPPISGTAEHVFSGLAGLPVLKKSTVKEENEAFWAYPLLPFTRFHTTSGTSGTPLRLPATLSERAFSQAVYEAWVCRISGNPTPRTLNLSGFMTPSHGDKDVCWVDSLSAHAYLSIYSLSTINRGKVLDLFNSLQPQLIYGYASAVHQLSLLLKDQLQESKDKRIAIVTSEVLQPQWRVLIESTLCKKVYNLYGSQEGSHAVMECVEGSMHINPLIGIVEIVGEHGGPVQEGEYGKVLVTGLAKRSMPLIRYDIGDIAQSTGYDSHCVCGLHWPTIGRIEGRSEDLVRTSDGRHIGYLCFHATKDLRGIKEAQIIQKGYNKFICNIVKSENELVETKYLEENIKKQINKRLGTTVDISFCYLSAIARGANGKFKAVVVDLDKEK